MAWMEMDYSKHTYFRWKVKWQLVHLDVLGTMGEMTPLKLHLPLPKACKTCMSSVQSELSLLIRFSNDYVQIHLEPKLVECPQG